MVPSPAWPQGCGARRNSSGKLHNFGEGRRFGLRDSLKVQVQMSSGVQIAIVANQLISGRLSSFCAVTALLGPLDPGDVL